MKDMKCRIAGYSMPFEVMKIRHILTLIVDIKIDFCEFEDLHQ